METKPALGHWCLGSSDRKLAIFNKEGEAIALIVPQKGSDYRHAKHIVAYPELLEALRMFMSAGVGNSTDFDAQHQAWKMASRVIAKVDSL